MTRSPVAAIIRGWVRLYTRGLPGPVRDTRRNQVEDDVWCEHEEAAELGRSGHSLGADLVLRLLFGIPADISWRLEQRHRGASVSTGVVASLSIVGGSALASASIIWGMFDATSALAIPGRLLFFTGFGGLAIAMWGLVARFNDRIGGGVALLGVIGGFGSVSAALGTATALGLVGSWFFLLPIGSTAVALSLSRHGTMPTILAIVHALVAFAVVPIVFGMWSDSPVGGLASPAVPYALPWVPYALTWIFIGVTLLRGQPELDKPVLKPD